MSQHALVSGAIAEIRRGSIFPRSVIYFSGAERPYNLWLPFYPHKNCRSAFTCGPSRLNSLPPCIGSLMRGPLFIKRNIFLVKTDFHFHNRRLRDHARRSRLLRRFLGQSRNFTSQPLFQRLFCESLTVLIGTHLQPALNRHQPAFAQVVGTGFRLVCQTTMSISRFLFPCPWTGAGLPPM